MGRHHRGHVGLFIHYPMRLSAFAAAEASATRKRVKYAGIATTHAFVTVAVESMGPLG